MGCCFHSLCQIDLPECRSSANVQHLQLICSRLLQWWSHLESCGRRGMLKNQLWLNVSLFLRYCTTFTEVYFVPRFHIICIAFITQTFYRSLGHIKASLHCVCLFSLQESDYIWPFSFQRRLLCLLNIFCWQTDASWGVTVAWFQCKLLHLHLQELKASAQLSSLLTVWSHKTCSTFCSRWPSNGIVWESVEFFF